MFAPVAICVLVPVAVSRWEAVEQIGRLAKLPVVMEWDGTESSSFSLGDSRESTNKRLRAAASSLGCILRLDDKGVCFEMKALPREFRSFSWLESWAQFQPKRTRKILEGSDGSNIQLRCNYGETVSIRELQAEGLFKTYAIKQCFLDNRFIVRADGVKEATLIELLGSCVGAEITTSKGGIKKLELAPAAFRERRKRLLLSEFPNPGSIGYFDNLAGSIAYDLIGDKELKNLFERRDAEILIRGEIGSPIDRAVRSAWDQFVQLLKRQKQPVPTISTEASGAVELNGNGGVGRVVYDKAGTAYHF